ncbi:MAG TPA: 50S ribosomal protein L25 [Candidatus Acidoferrales bacterium]|nr:50S ribosomal protein L25 [Candidatus Acidoferrales bacterium]
MSNVIQLNGTRRQRLGKGGARKARAAGQVPGVLYGHGETPLAVAVATRDLQVAMRHHKGGNAIVNLNVEGSEYTALVREAQYDPVSHAVLHLDFQHISLTETIQVEVEVKPVGVPVGVREAGGILEIIVRTVEVRCLPTAIPDEIPVDVAHLQIGDSVHVRDIKVEGVTIVTDLDATLATVVPPIVEEAPVAAEAAPVEGATPSEPEVVGAKGKKEDEVAGEKEKKAPAEKDKK